MLLSSAFINFHSFYYHFTIFKVEFDEAGIRTPFVNGVVQMGKKIEAINIKYGKIEDCKIDTILISKILRRLTSNKNDVNIEFSIENGKIKTVTSKLASTYLTTTVKTGSPVRSNGVIASPIIISRGPPHPHPTGTPFDPFFTVDVK